MVKARLSRRNLRSSRAVLRYQNAADRPSASRLLCACLFLLVLLILAVLFQGFLILNNGSEDGKAVDEVASAAGVSKTKIDSTTPQKTKNSEESTKDIDQELSQAAAKEEASEHGNVRKTNHKAEEKKQRKMTPEERILAAKNRMSKDYDYDAIRESDGKHESYQEQYMFDFSTLDKYTSPDVLQFGCNLTTVLVEPRLPTADFNYAGLFTLESVATYVSYSCVVLQTSSCLVLPVKDGEDPEPMSRQIEEVAKQIYRRALPMFRGMMERGLVRITILDHTKYQLTDCTNFYTPSNAWMSVNYWKDEFIEKVDNEMILIVQSDGVICRDFDVTLWSDLAFVGAPWAPNRWTGASVCDQLRSMFESSWTNVTRDEEASKDSTGELRLQNYCENGYGCGYNGGIVLRNWTWMVRAIEACPSELYSGVSASGKNCFVEGDVQEDEYFTLVLHGMGAPMPTAYEAALFGVETFFAEQAKEYFGPYSRSQIEQFLLKRWGKEGVKLEEKMHSRKTYGYHYNNNDNNLASSTLRTIPLTFHSPWTYHAIDIILGPQVQQECKFLQYMFRESEAVFQWLPPS